MANYDYVIESGETRLLSVEAKSDKAFILSNPQIEIYQCTTTTPVNVLALTPATSTVIDDGYLLEYSWNSTGMAPGKYLAYFQFDRDGIEIRRKKVTINILAVGDCC